MVEGPVRKRQVRVRYGFVPYDDRIESLVDIERIRFAPYERQTGISRYGEFLAFGPGEVMPKGGIEVPIRDAQRIFGPRLIRKARSQVVRT